MPQELRNAVIIYHKEHHHLPLLAEKALHSVLRSEQEFMYKVMITSKITFLHNFVAVAGNTCLFSVHQNKN